MGNIPEIAMGEHLRTPVGFRPDENRKILAAADIPREDKTVLMGIGNATTRANVETSTEKCFFNMYTETEATSGDSRGIYWQHYLSGVGVTGDCARFAARVNAAGVAGAFGVHSTAAVDVGMNVTGLANGVRATLEVAAESRSVGGTLAALQVDSFIGAGNTMPATACFIRVTDVGSVKLARALEFAVTPGATTCVGASRAAAGGTDNYLKVRVNGTDKEIPIWPGAAVKDAQGGLLWGEGSLSTRVKTSTADKCFIKFYTESDAASSDSRGIYWQHWISSGTGVTQGEAGRFFTKANAVGVNQIHGVHATAQIQTSATVTGTAIGLRATFAAQTESRTVTGFSLQLDTDVAANNTMGATSAFIRVTDENSVKMPNFLTIEAGSSILAGSAANSASDAIKVYIEGTGVRYLDLHDGVA